MKECHDVDMAVKQPKRLVVCFDGTWNGRRGGSTSNVSRLCNCLAVRSGDGTQQIVCYLPGVGTNYFADRFLGGAFGLGMRQTILTGYKFFCANYELGDHLFLFGFSRGAFAARSLASMVSFPGLLIGSPEGRYYDQVGNMYAAHSRALHDGRDPMSAPVSTFRNPRQITTLEEAMADLRGHFTSRFGGYPPAEVRFLGVFDTVSALGRHGLHPVVNSHNLSLSPSVHTARQALAIDERRFKFAPELWRQHDGEAPAVARMDVAADPERVKQVWFEGAHSDVGGGAHPEGSLADTALLWMLLEAHEREGLACDYWSIHAEMGYLKNYPGAFGVHESLKWWARPLGLPRLAKQSIRHDDKFRGRYRTLRPEGALNVRVATSAIKRFRGEYRTLVGPDGKTPIAEQTAYRPRNMVDLARESDGFSGIAEPVWFLPYDLPPGSPFGLANMLPESFTGLSPEELEQMNAVEQKVWAERMLRANDTEL